MKIFLKTEDEIELMRRANQLVGKTLGELAKHIGPGVTTLQLDRIADEFIRDHGAVPTFKGVPNPYGSPFPASICTSVNDVVVHGIPSESEVLKDGDMIDLGGRGVQVLHTPGHSPGHMCFFDQDRGDLFTGDLVYKDTLFAYYPSTDPEAYLRSLERVANLPVSRVFPAHHSLDIHPEILGRMRDAFRQLKAEGRLHHGSGMYEYGDWAVWL